MLLHRHRHRQQELRGQQARLAQAVVDEKAGQPAIAVHERVDEDERERHHGGMHQGVQARRSLVAQAHQAVHQLHGQFGGRRHIRHAGSARDIALQSVLFGAELHGLIQGVGHGGVLQRDQQLFGQWPFFVSLPK